MHQYHQLLRLRCDLGVVLVVALAIAACDRGPRLKAATPRDGRLTPVLIELFTSEGCSSCPPADRLLSELLATQPIPGVEIIALAEHVDYWDRRSWRDRFSSPDFTARQIDYRARVFPTSIVYTPQLVVDGTLECIGSDVPAVRQAIEQAAAEPKANVRAAVSGTGLTRMITVDVRMPATMERRGPADVVAVVLEDGLETAVAAGENRGRRLRHQAVVRTMAVIDELAADDTGQIMSAVLPIEPTWATRRLRFVAFVQEQESRRVLGAAAASPGAW